MTDIEIVRNAIKAARDFYRDTPKKDAQIAVFEFYARLEPSDRREPRSVQLERYRTVFAMELVRLEEAAMIKRKK